MAEILPDWSMRCFRSWEDPSTSNPTALKYDKRFKTWGSSDGGELLATSQQHWNIVQIVPSGLCLRGLCHVAFRTLKSTLTTTLLIFGEQKKDVFLPHVMLQTNWVPFFPCGNLLKGLEEWPRKCARKGGRERESKTWGGVWMKKSPADYLRLPPHRALPLVWTHRRAFESLAFHNDHI